MNLFGLSISRQTCGISEPLELYSMGGETTTRINTNTICGQIDAYNKCVVVAAIINKKATAVTNGKLYVVDSKGEQTTRTAEIENMQRMNPFQNIAEFTSTIEAYMSLFGAAYILKDEIIGFKSYDYYVIPNDSITPNLSLYKGSVYSDNIVDYTITLGGKMVTVEKKDIYVIKDRTFCFDMYQGVKSRLGALNDIVNTFVSSYEAVNELMVNRGALGIISLKSSISDVAAANIPQLKNETEDIQAKLSKYGMLRNKFKYIISNREASFTPVSSTISDLGLTQTQINCKKEIAFAYDMPSILLDVEGTTFANLSEAKKSFYNECIIPDALHIFEFINKMVGNDVYKVVPYFDHMEFYQDAKLKQAQGFTALIDGLDKAIRSGLMTTEQAREELNRYAI